MLSTFDLFCVSCGGAGEVEFWVRIIVIMRYLHCRLRDTDSTTEVPCIFKLAENISAKWHMLNALSLSWSWHSSFYRTLADLYLFVSASQRISATKVKFAGEGRGSLVSIAREINRIPCDVNVPGYFSDSQVFKISAHSPPIPSLPALPQEQETPFLYEYQ